MQLTQSTVDKYRQQAPELLEAVTGGEAEHIMRRDPDTDYCVKYDQGWCGIHRDYGTDYLGDACHFFPRVTRRMGEQNLMTASLSCPEVVRLMLNHEDAFAMQTGAADRLPDSLKNYLPEGLDAHKATAVHQAFLQLPADTAITPQRALMRIRSVADSLPRLAVASWPQAVPFYLGQADHRLAAPEPQAADPFNLLHALQGLIAASRKTPRPRLEETIRIMSEALAVTLDWDRVSIQLSPQSAEAYLSMQQRWQTQCAAEMAPVLRRWLQGQLAVMLFPYAGLGDTLADRVTILGVRFATIQLALMSACAQHGAAPPQADIVRIIQSLARFMDHLADPTLSLQIYAETGWTREARLRALVCDA